jgi:DNA-binding response OmpR family regulator
VAKILLSKFDDEWTQSLVELFQREHHQVAICSSGQSVLNTLERTKEPYELLVVDVSADHENAMKLVKQIKRFRFQCGNRLKVLCVSRVYRDPRFEFELEKEGARLVYVH